MTNKENIEQKIKEYKDRIKSAKNLGCYSDFFEITEQLNLYQKIMRGK